MAIEVKVNLEINADHVPNGTQEQASRFSLMVHTMANAYSVHLHVAKYASHLPAKHQKR